jgi:hypothetical protein
MDNLKIVVVLVLGLALVPLAVLESRILLGAVDRTRMGPFSRAAGGVFISLLALFAAYTTCGAVRSGSVHCVGRGCGFYYSAAEQPFVYWVAIVVWYALSVFLLSVGFAVLRSCFRVAAAAPRSRRLPQRRDAR